MQLSVLLLALAAFTSIVRGTRTNAALKAKRSSDADAADNSDVQFLESADAQPLPAQDGAGAELADEFSTDLAMKEASQRHQVMKQFMKNFAMNMRRAVLQDSGGDMPEDERQSMLAQVDSESPPEDNPDAEWMEHERHAHHRHMLNGGRLVPSHPAVDMERPPMDEEMEQPRLQPTHRHRHHRMMLNHMLNARHQSQRASDESSEDSEEQPAPVEQQAEEAPAEESSAPLRAPDGRLVVADALGRKMPMLFSRPGEEQPQPPKRSGTQGVAYSVGVLAFLIALQ